MSVLKRLLVPLLAVAVFMPVAEAAVKHRGKKPDYRYKVPKLKYKKPKFKRQKAHHRP